MAKKKTDTDPVADDAGSPGQHPHPSPLPPAGEGAGAEEMVRVAFFYGTEEIGFFGQRWVRGAAQAVTALEWQAMQSRADCAAFGFRIINEERV